MFLEVLILGVLTAFLTIFINYCIGKPGSEKFSPYEIFSFYTVWLSKRRLKKVSLLREYEKQYVESRTLLNTQAKGTAQVIQLDNDFKIMLYNAAEPFFTWERAAGMCPNCFGVWVAGISFGVLATIVIKLNIYNVANFIDVLILIGYLLIVVLISHIIIRLLTKII